MEFLSRKDTRVDDKIASGMDAARESVVDNGEVIETTLEWFEDLRTAVGDIQVIAELEVYVGSLSKRSRTTDQNYALCMEMVDVLKQVIAELRTS